MTSYPENAIIVSGDTKMEFLIVLAMIVIIMLCLGFGVGDIIMLALMIFSVLAVLTGVFFVLSLIMLIFSRKKKGTFTRINEEGRFPVAVYEVDGAELKNVFPCEMILRDKLYVPEKTVTLYFTKFRGAVIDKNAFITIIAGSAIFIPIAVGAAMSLVSEFSGFFAN